ncbi:MAG: S-adenosylmethionine:tRNA ribosyltransferase-isomerase, partial [Clostridia bacterium]|nr:S-adenosylmethionine:tRNA ribosyltransferase-isomerase [Clostridia bacterium]
MQSLHDYYYSLPEELIAQTPCEKRDECRLLVLDRKTGEISHRRFYDVIDYMDPGDCLVINDSRVIPARIYGVKVRKTSDRNEPSRVECLLLRQRELDTWECIVHPGKRVRAGAV